MASFIERLEALLHEFHVEGVGNDPMAGTGTGHAERYEFDEVHFIVECPAGKKPVLCVIDPDMSSMVWLDMCNKYGVSEEPNPADFVIEVAGSIHQRFTVTPLRQEFYEWDKAILAIAQKQADGQRVWLHHGDGNFQEIDMTEELERIIHEREEQARQSGSEEEVEEDPS